MIGLKTLENKYNDKLELVVGSDEQIKIYKIDEKIGIFGTQIRNLAIFCGLLKLNDDCSTFPTITINSMLQRFQRVDSQGDLKIYDPIRLESVMASQLLDYLTFKYFLHHNFLDSATLRAPSIDTIFCFLLSPIQFLGDHLYIT